MNASAEGWSVKYVNYDGRVKLRWFESREALDRWLAKRVPMRVFRP